MMVTQLNLAQGVGPAQKSDPELAPWCQLAWGMDPTWELRDNGLYRVTPVKEWLVVPTALHDELLQ